MLEVTTKLLTAIRAHSIQTISDQKSGVASADVAWVLTVPAMWDENVCVLAKTVARIKRKESRTSVVDHFCHPRQFVFFSAACLLT